MIITKPRNNSAVIPYASKSVYELSQRLLYCLNKNMIDNSNTIKSSNNNNMIIMIDNSNAIKSSNNNNMIIMIDNSNAIKSSSNNNMIIMIDNSNTIKAATTTTWSSFLPV